MKAQDILNCSFPLWYVNFKEVTIDALVVKVPQVFLDYLSTDGIYLPDSDSQPHGDFGDNASTLHSQNLIQSGDNPQSVSPQESRVQNLLKTDDFKEFQDHVVQAIAELGGKVFPKLNWSSPRDACWIAVNGTLCCETFNDICLLLKSSDFIAHDLTDPFMLSSHTNCSDHPQIEYVLVLKQWMEIMPSGEYRCFVRDKNLIAISQRSSQYYSFIESEKGTITRKINRFFNRVMKPTFPNESFVFDVYLAGGSAKPLLVDINPFTTITDSLLFSWEELNGESALPEVEESRLIENIAFRHILSEGEIFFAFKYQLHH